MDNRAGYTLDLLQVDLYSKIYLWYLNRCERNQIPMQFKTGFH